MSNPPFSQCMVGISKFLIVAHDKNPMKWKSIAVFSKPDSIHRNANSVFMYPVYALI